MAKPKAGPTNWSSESEPLERKTGRALGIIEILQATYPDAKCSLEPRNAFRLMVATILAAQCTDERVNMVTPGLFERYPTIQSFAEAREEDIQEIIRSTGFFRQKSRSIIEASQDIMAKFGGEVPGTLAELTTLRGVGRKTANLVLGECFDTPGMVVDTHVTRLSQRLGLTSNTDPTKIEFDLMKVVPERHWTELNHLLVSHGRAICKAPTPRCDQCPVLELCPTGRERMGMAQLGE